MGCDFFRKKCQEICTDPESLPSLASPGSEQQFAQVKPMNRRKEDICS